MRNRTMSRRGFLSATAAAAAMQIVPRHVLGGPDQKAPSDMITSAVIGMGGTIRGVTCDKRLAICDVRRDKLGGTPGEKGPDGVDRYTDFRHVLDRDDIDAVAVGSTETWHAIHVIESMKAGKDVLGEKPMSMTIREAAAIRDAAKRYARVFQHVTQRTSSGAVQYARHLVETGKIGKVVAAGVNSCQHDRLAIPGPCSLPAEPLSPEMLDWDLWVGPSAWRPFHSFAMRGVLAWHVYFDFGRNMVNGGAIHPNDAVRHILGHEHESPVEIHPADGKQYQSITTWKYADGTFLQVGFEGLPIPEQVRKTFPGFSYGGPFAIIGTEGKLVLDVERMIWSDPPDLARLPADFQPSHPVNHLEGWQECIRTRRKPICNEDAAWQSQFLCHSSEIAQTLRRPLKWDPVKEEFLGDEEANRLTFRTYRSPWRL
jgi:predicted dehydrogenase